jgi:hypothetical protein
MELSLQTPTVKKENGNYRHTILKTYRPARKTNTVYQYQCSGFYYIGKNAAYIDKLVKIYNSGYASDGMENVMVELLKSLAQEKNVLPELVGQRAVTNAVCRPTLSDWSGGEGVPGNSPRIRPPVPSRDGFDSNSRKGETCTDGNGSRS